MASFYGNESGSKTASGQRFNQNAMTAAHRSLPFGTKLRVTHGGQSVVVTINDRGPFIRGRVLDLSTGAARAIGLTGSGVGQRHRRGRLKRVARRLRFRSDNFSKRCVAVKARNLLRAEKSLPSPMTAGFFLDDVKKLCGSTSTSSLRLPLVFGPAASHSRKYSDRSTSRSDFTSRRKR